MDGTELDGALRQLGYEHIGGISNRVFLHRQRGEVLKLAVGVDSISLPYKLAGFQACLEAGAMYAPEGIMPEVLEAGADFAGTGYPFLRERYVPGRNLNEEYIQRPQFWDLRLPEELVRIYGKMLDGPTRDVSRFWDERLESLDELRESPHFARFAPVHAACREAALFLKGRCTIGYRLHGDLQFGNLIARGDDGVMLIDWELTSYLPLVFEFAHFYVFLHDPVPQVEDHLKSAYAHFQPLRRLWEVLAPRLSSEFGIGGQEFEQAVLVHATGHIGWLDRALRLGRAEDADYWEWRLRRLVDGEVFRNLQVPI